MCFCLIVFVLFPFMSMNLFRLSFIVSPCLVKVSSAADPDTQSPYPDPDLEKKSNPDPTPKKTVTEFY